MAYLEVQLRQVRKSLASKLETSNLFKKGWINANWLDGLTLQSGLAQALINSEELADYPQLFIAELEPDQLTTPNTEWRLTYLDKPAVDCKGHTLVEVQNTGLDECKHLCANTPACTLVTVGIDGKKYHRVCWLKEHFTEKSVSSVTGILYSDTKCKKIKNSKLILRDISTGGHC
jgi:hypothetical protein